MLTRAHHKDCSSLLAIMWDAPCDCKEIEMEEMPLPLAIGQLEILLWTLANATPEHRELAYKKILAHDAALRAEIAALTQQLAEARQELRDVEVLVTRLRHEAQLPLAAIVKRDREQYQDELAAKTSFIDTTQQMYLNAVMDKDIALQQLAEMTQERNELRDDLEASDQPVIDAQATTIRNYQQQLAAMTKQHDDAKANEGVALAVHEHMKQQLTAMTQERDEAMKIQQSEECAYESVINDLISERDDKQQQLTASEARYNELIMQVGKKFPNESRHETAQRYLNDHENRCGAQQAAQHALAQGEQTST